MSRDARGIAFRQLGFPRVSGDEPSGPNHAPALNAFSPRERG